MKRIASCLLTLILVAVFALPASAAGTAKPSLFVNGQRIAADNAPVVDKAGVYVPFKAVFGALGYTVSYDAKAKTYSLKSKSTAIRFTVGGTSALVNGQKKVLTLAPKAIGSTIYVPMKFMTETIKLPAVYDKTLGVVQIGKTAVVDQFFKLSFGLSMEQVKKLEAGKQPQSSKDEDGKEYLYYDDATFANGATGSISYGFRNGKLDDVLIMFYTNTSDFDVALAEYDQDKAYLEKIYNKGTVANDVLWYADEEQQAQYAEEFADDEYSLLATALTYGDLDLEATYKSAAFSVTVNLTNLNFDEMDDPYYMHTIAYVKN